MKQSYEEIEKDIEDLKQSMEILHDLVTIQQESIDTIEDFIRSTKNNVSETAVDVHIGESMSSRITGTIAGTILIVLGVLILF